MTTAEGVFAEVENKSMMRTCGCYLGPTPFPGQEPCEIGYAVDGDRDGEVSPRVNRTDEERATQARAPKGRIFVRTSSAEANTGQGLFGQVVINANDEHAGQPPLDYWGGEVMIGDDPLIVPHIFDPLIPNKFVLRTPALMGDLPIDLAPYYDRRSDTNPSDFAGGAPGLGYEGLDGGAVGLVPYKLHATDSRPSNDPAWSASIPTLIQVNVIDFDLWWPDPSPGDRKSVV